MTVRRADIHQHLWPDALLSSLARRTVAPRLRRDGREWLLELEGDAPAPFDPRDHDLAPRAALAEADGLQRVVVAPVAPARHRVAAVGRPRRCSTPSIAACSRRARRSSCGGAWCWAIPLRARVESLLDAGAVGLSLPAGALSGPAGIERLGPALEALSASAAPLFIHPGPAAGSPAWFPALTAYVAEMSTAWHAWAQWGRPAHPRAAGRLRDARRAWRRCTPSGSPRAAAPAEAVHDPLTAFDTSSYGPKAIDAMLRVVGVDRLLYGSDRPVIEPAGLAALGAAAEHAISVTNPERFV